MITNKNTLIYNVDTQVDFIEQTGKLYVPESDKLKPVFRKIQDLAKNKKIRVVSSQDWHGIYTNEISTTPDFNTTFPEHCMAYTHGAKIVNDSLDEEEIPFIIDWDRTTTFTDNGILNRNIIIRKDKFNVFDGNTNTTGLFSLLIDNIGIKNIFVYGVVTEICVAAFIDEIMNRYKNINIYLISDAIMHLDEGKSTKMIEEWRKNEKFILTSSNILVKTFEFNDSI